MAKIALVGYGSQGQSTMQSGKEYAYMVNDNVNVGDKMQVVATNWKTKKKFATTAVAGHVLRENSKMGQEAKTLAQSQARFTDGEITTAYTGAQLGIGGFRGDKAYQQQVRAQNLQMYLQENPQFEPTQNAAKGIAKYGNPKGAALLKYLR